MGHKTHVLSGSSRALAIVLVAAAVAALAGAYFHHRVLTTHSGRLADLAGELARLENAGGSDVGGEFDVAGARRELHRLAGRVPTNAEVGALLEELSAALAEGRVVDREMTTRSTVRGRPFSRIPLTLRLSGSFEQVFSLLVRVERSDRLVRVDQVNIEKTAGDGGPALQAGIELSTFSRDEQETAAWATAE